MENFVRQRRNIILISIVLILFDFADIQIGKVSILGTNLIIGNPDIIHYFMWIMWTYFLIRYYQYFVQEENKQIKDTFNDKFKEFTSSKTCNYFKEKHNIEDNRYKECKLEKIGFLSWNYVYCIYNPVVGNEEKIREICPIHIVVFSFVYSIFCVTVNTSKVTEYIFPFLLAFSVPIVKIIF